jgi:hypothetical protein
VIRAPRGRWRPRPGCGEGHPLGPVLSRIRKLLARSGRKVPAVIHAESDQRTDAPCRRQPSMVSAVFAGCVARSIPQVITRRTASRDRHPWVHAGRMQGEVEHIAEWLRQRNAIDAKIAGITSRPMAAGHLGEWLASQIFDIRLESNAANPGIDGAFSTGPLIGRTVNIKWYLKQEGLLDIAATSPDYYLVMTGPASPATSTKGHTRPWCITSVFLFETKRLLRELHERGVKVGIATSVRVSQWEAAELYPHARNAAVHLHAEQQRLLSLFACD